MMDSMTVGHLHRHPTTQSFQFFEINLTGSDCIL